MFTPKSPAVAGPRCPTQGCRGRQMDQVARVGLNHHFQCPSCGRMQMVENRQKGPEAPAFRPSPETEASQTTVGYAASPRPRNILKFPQLQGQAASPVGKAPGSAQGAATLPLPAQRPSVRQAPAGAGLEAELKHLATQSISPKEAADYLLDRGGLAGKKPADLIPLVHHIAGVYPALGHELMQRVTHPSGSRTQGAPAPKDPNILKMPQRMAASGGGQEFERPAEGEAGYGKARNSGDLYRRQGHQVWHRASPSEPWQAKDSEEERQRKAGPQKLAAGEDLEGGQFRPGGVPRQGKVLVTAEMPYNPFEPQVKQYEVSSMEEALRHQEQLYSQGAHMVWVDQPGQENYKNPYVGVNFDSKHQLVPKAQSVPYYPPPEDRTFEAVKGEHYGAKPEPLSQAQRHDWYKVGREEASQGKKYNPPGPDMGEGAASEYDRGLGSFGKTRSTVKGRLRPDVHSPVMKNSAKGRYEADAYDLKYCSTCSKHRPR